MPNGSDSDAAGDLAKRIDALKKKKKLTKAERAMLRELQDERKRQVSAGNDAATKRGNTKKAGGKGPIKVNLPKDAAPPRFPVAARDMDALKEFFDAVEEIDGIDPSEAVTVIKDGKRQVWINPESPNWRSIYGRFNPNIQGDVDHVYPKGRAKQQGYAFVRLEDVPASPNRSAGAGWEKRTMRLPTEQRGLPGIRFADPAQKAKVLGVPLRGASRGYPGMRAGFGLLRKIPVAKLAQPLILGGIVFFSSDARAATEELMTPNQSRLKREWPNAPLDVWHRAITVDSILALDPTVIASEGHQRSFDRYLENIMPRRSTGWTFGDVRRPPDEERRDELATSLIRKGPAGARLASLLYVPQRIEDAWDENIAEPLSEGYDRFTNWIDDLEFP